LKFRINKRGVVDDWLPLIFFLIVVVLLYLWFGVFFIGSSSAMASPTLRYSTTSGNMVMFLNTPVSSVYADYKTELGIDEGDTFADVIHRLCSSTSVKSNFPNDGGHAIGFYYWSNKNDCINGAKFSKAVDEAFLSIGMKRFTLGIFDGGTKIFNYNQLYPKSAGEKVITPVYANVILPSGKTYSTMNVVIGG
jgi:hypothetical protein